MELTKKTSPLIVTLRVLFTLCILFTVVFIFQNSLQNGVASSLRSEQVRAAINKIADLVGLGPFSSQQIRKLAHFSEFALLGFWFMLCLRVYTPHFIRHISWPLFVCLSTAVADETIQLYVDGRGSSVKDVLIDFAGSCMGLFVAVVVLMFFRMCYILFVHRNEV